MKGINLIYKLITIMLIFILVVTSVTFIAVPQVDSNVSAGVIEGIENKINELINNSVVRANTLEYYKNITEVIAPTYEIKTCSYTKEEVVEEEIIIEPDAYELYSEYEIYELAKIIMCEAEGESQECKEYVGQVIINRVNSDKFPDTIHDVIFQHNQFTPTFDGRWELVEPNEDCYDAAYKVINISEPLTDALYFEACNGGSWHSRNLIQIAEIDNTRFYIE